MRRAVAAMAAACRGTGPAESLRFPAFRGLPRHFPRKRAGPPFESFVKASRSSKGREACNAPQQKRCGRLLRNKPRRFPMRARATLSSLAVIAGQLNADAGNPVALCLERAPASGSYSCVRGRSPPQRAGRPIAPAVCRTAAERSLADTAIGRRPRRHSTQGPSPVRRVGGAPIASGAIREERQS
jgi:hypothetical protein